MYTVKLENKKIIQLNRNGPKRDVYRKRDGVKENFCAWDVSEVNRKWVLEPAVAQQ